MNVRELIERYNDAWNAQDLDAIHGLHDPATNVTDDDEMVTGKIARAHLNEFPDYYTRLERMEAEAERDWAGGD